MALDWSKDISFSGLRRAMPQQRSEYPSKTYMNLIVEDQQERSTKRTGLTTLAIALALGVGAKFGVYDFYARVVERSNELSEKTNELQLLRTQLKDYSEVQEEYYMYESARMTSEVLDVPIMDALALVDRHISKTKNADVATISLADNTLTINVSGITLGQVGTMVNDLYEEPIVADVEVRTATNNYLTTRQLTNGAVITTDKTTVDLVIALQTPDSLDVESITNDSTESTTDDSLNNNAD